MFIGGDDPVVIAGLTQIGDGLELLAGEYVVAAKVQLGFDTNESDPALVECRLEAESNIVDRAAVLLQLKGPDTIPLTAPVSLSGSGRVALLCDADSARAASASRVKITAIQVDSLTIQP